MNKPYRIWNSRDNTFDVCSGQQFFGCGSEIYKDLPPYTFSDDDKAVGDFDTIAERTGFTHESMTFNLNVYTKGDVYLFCFDNCETWIAIRVEGMLNYILFIKEWANPFIQFQKLVYKHN